jgi:hypothetical protein
MCHFCLYVNPVMQSQKFFEFTKNKKLSEQGFQTYRNHTLISSTHNGIFVWYVSFRHHRAHTPWFSKFKVIKNFVNYL